MSGAGPRENRLSSLGDSETVYVGAAVETAAESLIELYGLVGLDWVWIDLEHKNASPLDGTNLERLSRAGECGNVELVVRLPDSNPATVRKVLDAGVRNVVIPRIETATDLRRAAEACYFEYGDESGARGLSQGRSSGYGTAFLEDSASYYRTEDDAVQLGALIEEEQAVENLPAILDVPGLDFVFPGPGDLGVSMGHPLEYDHPAVSDRIEYVEETCRDRGIPMLGMYHSNFTGRGGIQQAIERGYRLLSVGNEYDFAAEILRERLSWFAE
ncbi:HpcH/HpaI aldolase family protein [Natrinema ejinorense]|uniref:Aldolase n=1 Tax=Natrinema ejinorense TaxID=373386 RepID=A0A2A5QPJ7_9EURY|nr:aldolase/citrate lyase family protein [Natrinema ejinorense]PCR88776.1 aldolase [Natrinema ejinorense]